MVFPKAPKHSLKPNTLVTKPSLSGPTVCQIKLPGEKPHTNVALPSGLQRALVGFAGFAKHTAHTVQQAVLNVQSFPRNPWTRDENKETNMMQEERAQTAPANTPGKLSVGNLNGRSSVGSNITGLPQSLKRLVNQRIELAEKLPQIAHPHRAEHGTAYDALVRGDAYRFQGKLDSAEEQYLEAITLDANYPEAHIALGKTYRELGRADEACQTLRKALPLCAFNKELRLELTRELAKAYNDTGNIERAITWYERTLKLDVADNDTRFGLALLVELHGDLTYAATLYEGVLDYDPEFLPAYNNLGSIYLRKGDYDEAEGFFRELIRRAPEFHRGYLGLAITLDRAGRGKEALFYYRHVLAIKPVGRNNEFIRTRIDELTGQVEVATDSSLLRRIK